MKPAALACRKHEQHAHHTLQESRMTRRPQNETTYTGRRLTVSVPGVRKFQQAYEHAVPDAPFD